jgi:uncharacterized protein (DUF1800 family)
MVVWNEENVAHLLARAGFGGSDRDVKKYLRLGQATAVEKLIGITGSSAKGPGAPDDDPDDRARLKAWWAKRMVKASSRRVQEKMCLFWHDHFASNLSTVNNNLRMALQNRTFRLYGLGSFRTLVHQVTKDAAMLDFLDGDRNKKGKPNENYARELMELFTLGVSDRNGIDNYTQTDVQELARCLTGFTIQNDVGVFDPTRFDAGTKTLFAGKSYQATGNIGVEDGNGNLLPPAQNLIDVLFTHKDSDGAFTMPRFIGGKLWEAMAYPAPSKALLDEVTGPFISGGFVIKDLLRAMFLHDEFYSEAAKTSSVKNPCEFAFHAARAFLAKTNGTTLPALLEDMGMDLFEPPTVNGWNTGLAWLSSGQFMARLQFAQTLAASSDKALMLVPSKLYDPAAPTAASVVDGLLGRLGIAARVPPAVRQRIVDYVAAGNPFTDPLLIQAKVRGAVALILALPEASIH